MTALSVPDSIALSSESVLLIPSGDFLNSGDLDLEGDFVFENRDEDLDFFELFLLFFTFLRGSDSRDGSLGLYLDFFDIGEGYLLRAFCLELFDVFDFWDMNRGDSVIAF